MYNYHSSIYSPTDAPNNIKMYIKTAPTCFGVTVTHNQLHIP